MNETMINAQEKATRSAPTGIFLLYEGLPPTIVESQVIAHVQSMKNVGVEIEIWAFAVTSQAFASGQAALESFQSAYPGIVIRLFRGVKPALPFSEIFNAYLLMWHMWRIGASPTFVRARTEHATMIAAIAKRLMKYRLIWDARGDTLAEFLEAVRSLPWYIKILAPLKSRAIKKRIKMAQKHCDYAIFVSEALRELQGSVLPVDRTLILPCLADESLFYFDPTLRGKVRSELGYSDNDLVIIYVGSTSIWQCVPETVSLMEQVMRCESTCKILIVTPATREFESLFSEEYRNRTTITSGKLRDMNRFLNAADIGVLLRKPSDINWVASPVKFGEYSLVGLPVITGEAIDQINKFSQYFENKVSEGEIINKELKKTINKFDRSVIAVKAKELNGSRSYTEKLKKFYFVSSC
ncbi:MAG: hypothetical protein WD623_14045 [Marinobacter sp.]|uniref:hypothetical protein n=1 Tax=Marinobacter sp. TaxID=50741 RepID=UPI0034A01E6E